MRTIYKYSLSPVVEQDIYVPFLNVDSDTVMKIKQQILKLDIQDNIPCLWIMVNNEQRERLVKVTLCGTGQKCYEPIEDYVDSFQIQQDSGVNFVFHVFVREKD